MHMEETCIGSIREKADLATKGEVVRLVGLSCVVPWRRKEGSRRGKREKRERERKERGGEGGREKERFGIACHAMRRDGG